LQTVPRTQSAENADTRREHAAGLTVYAILQQSSCCWLVSHAQAAMTLLYP
jgi:hypothetical protein